MEDNHAMRTNLTANCYISSQLIDCAEIAHSQWGSWRCHISDSSFVEICSDNSDIFTENILHIECHV